jgi:hypothetical protein
MWPGTTINIRVLTIGSPKILTTAVNMDTDSPALENNFSINPSNGTSVKFVGGIFLDFLSDGPRTQMGANVTFSPSDRWRLESTIPSSASEATLLAALKTKYNTE